MEDGVGKKIVEALKMQDNGLDYNNSTQPVSFDFENYETSDNGQGEQAVATRLTPASIESAFQQSLENNLDNTQIEVPADDYEYPANVKVLKQLITKLPVGVSKQTGALIIKQTMEALGISIRSVIEEARQVQKTLNNNAIEYQNTIADYKRQISMMELKSQQCQRQAASMNDVIGLFINTGV